MLNKMRNTKVKEFLREGWSTLNRKKTITDDFHDTPLKKCLSTLDLTLLGIGHMIGAGIYVLTGTVVKDLAGPAAVLSYFFAAIAAILSALCYAEFGARVPKAGSAYSYTYVTLGEIWGFIIGWNIVLEHLLGASSVARAWSGGLDSIFNGAIKNLTLTHIGYLSNDNAWLSDYPDFVAFAATLIVFLVVATGAKFAMNFNNIFTVINLIVILLIIAMGFYYADINNWTNKNNGGFFPYSFGGAWAGAATCFYAYIGFEGVATASEEAKNPEKSVPFATILSLSIVTVLYVLVTCSLTLMVPYNEVDPTAAFPVAFAQRGAEWAKYVVAMGTLFGITTSLLGGAFSLPRAVYSMASDGLLFQTFAYVYPKTQTPIWGILCFGFLSALMALLFEIETLVEFMSIGTILAYTIVAVSVIILRYLPVHKCQFKLKPEEETVPEDTISEDSAIMKKSKSHDDFGKLKDHLRKIPFLNSFDPGNAAVMAILIMLVAIICFCAVLVPGYSYLAEGAWWAIILEIVFGSVIVLCFLILIAHEKNDAFLTFQIPFVPLIPCLSIFCNVTLMMKLNYLTWIRLGIWLTLGLLVYFLYGVWHSRERRTMPQYGEIIGYTGDANVSCNTISKMEEEILEQQPKRLPGEEIHIEPSKEL